MSTLQGKSGTEVMYLRAEAMASVRLHRGEKIKCIEKGEVGKAKRQRPQSISPMKGASETRGS